jgi:sec-independent protein translocase protein TatA
MGGLSLWHWLVVLAVAAVVFGGKGKISSVMGDFAKGIKAFKSGMKEEDSGVVPQVAPPGVATTVTETATGSVGERPAHEPG